MDTTRRFCPVCNEELHPCAEPCQPEPEEEEHEPQAEDFFCGYHDAPAVVSRLPQPGDTWNHNGLCVACGVDEKILAGN